LRQTYDVVNENKGIFVIHMVIAVSTKSLAKETPATEDYFIKEVFGRIVRNNPQYQFIFIADRAFNLQLFEGDNVECIVAGPQTSQSLFWKYWYDVKVPSLLKKYNADVFVSFNGCCSLQTKLPQCLVMGGMSVLSHPSLLRKNLLSFYKKYTKAFLQKANTVVAFSDKNKKEIYSRYATDENKIAIIPPVARELYRPATQEEKGIVKAAYTEGKEYFINTAEITSTSNLLTLLKAFSVFKKRQQTSMKLVLTGSHGSGYKQFKESLQSYKYRYDVVVTGVLPEEELVKLLGAACALVLTANLQTTDSQELEAMKCDVPVVTTTASSFQEIAGETALYADPADIAAIAAHLMLLYKDENWRNSLIKEGREIVTHYNNDKTASLLWQAISKAAIAK
jgi:glycosyltransferase involved in cell wall biosynthesis